MSALCLLIIQSLISLYMIVSLGMGITLQFHFCSKTEVKDVLFGDDFLTIELDFIEYRAG